MTRLRPWATAREHPIAIAVVGGVIAVQAAWMLGAAVCPRMTMTECVVGAIAFVAAASVLAIAVRAGWLAATTARALAALPRAAMPASLHAAARRAGITRCIVWPVPTEPRLAPAYSAPASTSPPRPHS